MKIYLHVGIHRTGSTFLQKNIFPQLSLENSSFIYNPETIIQILNDEYIKPLSSCKPVNFDELKKKIENQINKLKKKYRNKKDLKIMISNENLIPDNFFYKNELELFSPLKSLNNVFDNPIILIFIRERASLIKSIHNQHFKMGRYKSFDEFLHGTEEPNIDINKINFTLISQTIPKYIPHRIWIFKFETFNENIKKIIKLLDLKCSADIQSFSKFRNKSISNLTIKRTLKVNKILKASIIEIKIKKILNNYIFKEVDKIKLSSFSKSNHNIVIFFILKIFNKILILLRDKANLVSLMSFLIDNFFSTSNYEIYDKKKLNFLYDKNYKNLCNFIEIKINKK
jgi:hypothetical protein